MEVRNLFFNTPVRHRFLKTAQTEKGHIVEAFTRLALANPQVHFVLTNNDKQLYDLPPSTRWADRISAFFGAEIADALIPINSDDGQIRVSGYVCDPSVSRGNNRMQYLFLNGRHIRDRALQHALGEAYRGLLMVGRHPVCFLRMDMPAELMDVNVHPTKLEVRFTDGGRVYSRLLQSLQASVSDNQLDAAGRSAGTADRSGRVARTDGKRARSAGPGRGTAAASGDRLGTHRRHKACRPALNRCRRSVHPSFVPSQALNSQVRQAERRLLRPRMSSPRLHPARHRPMLPRGIRAKTKSKRATIRVSATLVFRCTIVTW